MTGIALTDNPQHTLAFYDLAVLTALLYGGTNLHNITRPKSLSFVSIRDTPARQIVRRKLHSHLVSGKYLYKVHPHLARDMGQNNMAIIKFHPEHRIRQWLDNLAFNLDCLFFGHTILYDKLNISGPSSVIATVCSKCAEGLPSAVT